MKKLVLVLLLPLQLFAQSDSIPVSGIASFYARKFSGRRTSNGETYDPKKFTCAHRTLPFGTVLKVTNPDNCRSVWVKVNDRGPFHRKRIIDLSLVAAKKLDIVQKGYAVVKLDMPQPEDNTNLADSVKQQYAEQEVTIIKKTVRKAGTKKAVTRTKVSRKTTHKKVVVKTKRTKTVKHLTHKVKVVKTKVKQKKIIKHHATIHKA